jgi:hypothetical protein
MLSKATATYLNMLTYRADAGVGSSWMPLGGIYWEDELPEHNQFFLRIPEGDRHDILRLFGIRVRLWSGQALGREDQQFWDTTQSLVPRWAFFKRLMVSADELHAQEELAKAAEEVFEALCADADQVEVTEKDGVQEYFVTRNLYKTSDAVQKKKSLWERLLRRLHSP